MTTREWADARQKMWAVGKEYRDAKHDYENKTNEFCKKLTLAKKEKILSPREVDIMRWRLKKHKTLEEVAKVYDVTRERIRMIEESVIERMIEL